MNKHRIVSKALILSSVVLLFSISSPAFSAFEFPLRDARVSGRVIVVFKDDTTSAVIENTLEGVRGSRVRSLSGVRAEVLERLSDNDIAALNASGVVKRIDDDVFVYALGQTLPWGVDRIEADQVWPSGNTGDPIKVGVIDTGISTKHPDLAANLKGGVNTINSWKGYNDDNGHGSHVAGTIAAVNNTSGVVGAAPNADLYAIKALNAYGSGYLSDIIEGIDWAIANGIQVVNMSLGTTANIQSFHDAVIRARNAGVVIVAAAGNDGGAVNYPAAYPEVIAVSAVDSSNAIASWSSRGSEVDLAAPGVSIYSTYKSTSYKTLSGTSMATPHVVGAAVLLMNTPVGANDLDADGVWDPAEVEARLKATATDLGAWGSDNLYGAGLVNAYAAVQ